MRRIETTSRFDRDFRRVREGPHGRKKLEGFSDVVTQLAHDEPLERRFRDHPLTGNWRDHRDCHIRPDLVLIYRKLGDHGLVLVRIGSHSELGL